MYVRLNLKLWICLPEFSTITNKSNVSLFAIVSNKYFSTDYEPLRNNWEDFLKSNTSLLFPGSVSKQGPGALSLDLLNSLQSLRDNVDSTLLPQSLHQVSSAGRSGNIKAPDILEKQKLQLGQEVKGRERKRLTDTLILSMRGFM